jgi:paraquat-inducible protein A
MLDAAAPQETIGLPLEELIACPQCDTLHHARMPPAGRRAVCLRCQTVLIAPKRNAYLRVVALSLTIVILMTGATLFPFLSVNVGGFSNRASVLDTALAFVDGGWMAALSVLVAAFIVMIPVTRAGLVIYVLAPLLLGRRPLPNARKALRWAEDLRPWSMAEIFIIGCAVALTKVADLAQIEFGPAFWMFGALVIVIVMKDGSMDRWSIWKALDQSS